MGSFDYVTGLAIGWLQWPFVYDLKGGKHAWVGSGKASEQPGIRRFGTILSPTLLSVYCPRTAAGKAQQCPREGE